MKNIDEHIDRIWDLVEEVHRDKNRFFHQEYELIN